MHIVNYRNRNAHCARHCAAQIGMLQMLLAKSKAICNQPLHLQPNNSMAVEEKIKNIDIHLRIVSGSLNHILSRPLTMAIAEKPHPPIIIRIEIRLFFFSLVSLSSRRIVECTGNLRPSQLLVRVKLVAVEFIDEW